jgi:hypothetical protein
MSYIPGPRDIPGHYGEYVADSEPSKAAGGLRLLAGLLMLTAGLFQLLQGIAAVANDKYFAIDPSYTYDTDATSITTWGWLHIIFGSAVALIGLLVALNTTIGRALGIPVLIISMLSNFFFIPHYPFWAISIIVFEVFALWAIVTAPARH